MKLMQDIFSYRLLSYIQLKYINYYSNIYYVYIILYWWRFGGGVFFFLNIRGARFGLCVEAEEIMEKSAKAIYRSII